MNSSPSATSASTADNKWTRTGLASPMARFILGTCYALFGFSGFVVLWLLYEISGISFGQVHWSHGGGAPGKITVEVRDPAGHPLKGLEVISTSSSGDSRPVSTDENGRAEIAQAEPEILRLKVGGDVVMTKDNVFEQWFAPEIGSQGIVFRVTAKHLK